MDNAKNIDIHRSSSNHISTKYLSNGQINYISSNLNKSNVRSDSNSDEIHIYLPEKNQVETTSIKTMDSNAIFIALENLKRNYDLLREKLMRRSTHKEIEVKNDENDLLMLNNNMNEMNKLIEQLEYKKSHLKEKNIMILLEKERKKFIKDKEKYVLIYEEQINKLKFEFEKANTARKEFEVKVKMLEPSKFELEKRVRALDQEKKSLEFELLKAQKDFSSYQSDVEKYRVLYNAKEKELKALIDRYEVSIKQKEMFEEENRKMVPKISKLETENIFLKNDNERIINETHLRMNELKREIIELNNRLKTLNLEINGYKDENDDLKLELRDERTLKERILIEKMNLETRYKEYEIEISNLRRQIDDLLHRPPQFIKDIQPQTIEKIVEKPIEKLIYVDNPEILKQMEFHKNQAMGLEKEVMKLKEELHCIQLEINDKVMEAGHWKGQFQQLERRKLEDTEIITNEKVRVLEQENDDLKYRLKFLTDELNRQCELNQEKNQNLAGQIRALNEKNLQLENIIQYYKFNKR